MKTKRFGSVELIRIIACFFVVALHTLEDIIASSKLNYFDSFILSMIFCGVSIFWVISGFFLFNNNDYKELVKKVFKKIWLPSFIINVVCVIAYDFYLSVVNGTKMLSVASYITNIIYGAISFKTFAPSCTHFWFIYTYCLVVIIYPVLKSFVDYIDQNTKRQNVFVFVALIFMLINEITFNGFASISNHGFGTVFMASIEIILGHILYKNRDVFINDKKSIWISALLFVASLLLRGIVFMQLSKNGLSTGVISSWYSILGILITCSLIVLIIRVVDDTKENKIVNLIQKIGPLTLYIYMVHKVPIKIIRKTGIETFIMNCNVITKYILAFAYVLCCFVLSLLISYILKKANIFIYAKLNNKSIKSVYNK